MDLKAFGETLSRLMKETKVRRKSLAEHVHVSVALIDKWKSTTDDDKQHRRPAYAQLIALITFFASQLDLREAQVWAQQAGHQILESDLRTIFQTNFFPSPPLPNEPLTYERLEPLPGHRLFGVELAQRRMLEALNHKDDHWLLAIDGIGGIGKTALANLLVREILRSHRFYDVAWISAKQEAFLLNKGLHSIDRPSLNSTSLIDNLLDQLDPTVATVRPPTEKQAILMHWFKQNPYLVIIDNLESIEDYEVLIDPLRKMANPTKFLLTSRYSLSQYADFFSHSLQELSQEDTFAFLKYQGNMRHISSLADAAESELAKIYEIVGGNPLALKLVIGQIQFTSLSNLLDSLKSAHTTTVDELYQFIFRQIWNTLDEITRQVLISTPLAQNGTSQDLIRLSEIDGKELQPALEQLIARSLIEVVGTLDQPRYRVHSLTKTFLHTKIFDKWKPT